ncbi:MAG: helix-turn-helix domain-containing protein [Propionibacteriaceae bacterium]|nr:helix-turn-helix domain-containing protein [Propionibacteriaceae bacterium]
MTVTIESPTLRAVSAKATLDELQPATATPKPLTPNYAVPAGEFIKEWMDDEGINAAELARRLDVSRKHVSELLRGKASLSPEISLRLERVTRIPSEYWDRIDSFYLREKTRLATISALAEHYRSLARFPLAYLRAEGFISAPEDDHGTVVLDVLEFFGVGDVVAIEHSWADSSVAYRKEAATHPRWEELATWLTAAERLTDLSALPDFDRSGLVALQPKLNELAAVGDIDAFLEAISSLNNAGVAFCFVAEIPTLPIHGATRWVRNHPLIQASPRRESNEHLWSVLLQEVDLVLEHQTTSLHSIP